MEKSHELIGLNWTSFRIWNSDVIYKVYEIYIEIYNYYYNPYIIPVSKTLLHHKLTTPTIQHTNPSDLKCVFKINWPYNKTVNQYHK